MALCLAVRSTILANLSIVRWSRINDWNPQYREHITSKKVCIFWSQNVFDHLSVGSRSNHICTSPAGFHPESHGRHGWETDGAEMDRGKSFISRYIHIYQDHEAPLLSATINSLFLLYYGTMMGKESYSATARQTDPLPGSHQRIFLLGLIILWPSVKKIPTTPNLTILFFPVDPIQLHTLPFPMPCRPLPCPLWPRPL